MLHAAKGLGRTVILLVAVAQAFLGFAWLKVRTRFRPSRAARAEWLHHACARALGYLGIETIPGGNIPSAGLVVCNHLSYLDILVLSAIHPCIFVSKAEVRRWPLFGPLAKLSGTIFVERERRTSSHQSTLEIEAALATDVPIILFPEGTSSDGSTVLRFHSALFEPAVRLGATITPASIGYSVERGSVAQDVCYWGEMTLVPHLLKLLSSGKIIAKVEFSGHSTIYPDRKQAASATWAEVLRLKDGRPRIPTTAEAQAL